MKLKTSEKAPRWNESLNDESLNRISSLETFVALSENPAILDLTRLVKSIFILQKPIYFFRNFYYVPTYLPSMNTSRKKKQFYKLI